MGSAHVLILCTANVCRSPMAVGLLAHHLGELDGHDGLDVVVTSAGTRSVSLGVDPQAVTALRNRGIDITAHVPRAVTRSIADVDGADLIITMTRSHLRHVATMGHGTFGRSFTMRELARRIETSGPRRDGEQLTDWVGRLAHGRRPSELLGRHPADDIDDPYGTSLAAVERTAAELDRLASLIARSAPWPRHSP